MVVFQVISWDARDIDDQYTITAYGRTAESHSVALSFTFQPYFFVRTGRTNLFAGYKTELFQKILFLESLPIQSHPKQVVSVEFLLRLT
jgi:hypothetical protein